MDYRPWSMDQRYATTTKKKPQERSDKANGAGNAY